MHNIEELKVWQKGMELVEAVYHLIKYLPNHEKFGLISQIKRSSIAIPSNIAEGAGRNSNKEFVRFLSIANGSTYELKTQLLLSTNLKFIKKKDIASVLKLCNEIQKMNRALQKRLQ